MSAPPLKGEKASCQSKKRFSDEFGARAWAAEACSRFKHDQMKVYPCSVCHGWHTSTNVANRKMRVTADDVWMEPMKVQDGQS